jgi:hypothetical protein
MKPARTPANPQRSWLQALGLRLAAYLAGPVKKSSPATAPDPGKLSAALRPGDVLLVEGNRRISTAIKYLTQSTWSHAALYVGEIAGASRDGEPCVFVEADIQEGVRAVPLSEYAGFNTRICRPVGLTDADRGRIVAYAVERIGQHYDMQNLIDLARYLLPIPPVPSRWRRRMLALGSGDPTRAICSTLIARAFQSVRYPILPVVVRHAGNGDGEDVREIFHIRHHSLFAPRDFDVSPYFCVVKPTLEAGFDYRQVYWADDAGPLPAGLPEGHTALRG